MMKKRYSLLLPLSLFILQLCIVPSATSQQTSSQQEQRIHPKLERYLNPDGTLKGDLQDGSIDATGWEMGVRSDGKPYFVPTRAAADDDNWDDRFGENIGSSGVDDEVFAMASDGQLLFLAGIFQKAGSLDVSNIVTWNGKNWDYAGPAPSVLQGTTGPINALAIMDNGPGRDTLWVGGQFETAGLKPAKNFAMYDILSRSWLDVGNITSTKGTPFVSTIAVHGTDVYVGGSFTHAGTGGGVAANNVAVYHAKTRKWESLGTGDANGVVGNVNALAWGPDGLYVGGNFGTAGGMSVQSLARWDGTEWHNIEAGGVDGFVNAIAVMDSTVFVGGGFTKAGDTVASNIAKWHIDSARWNRLSGFFWLTQEEPVRLEGNGTDGVVRTLTVDGDDLYVGGEFITAFPGDFTTTAIQARYIARWHENEGNPLFFLKWWAPLGRGMNGFVNAIARHEDALYAGGAFSSASGQPSDGIAKWDGVRWFSLSTGINNTITSLAVQERPEQDEIYVGGEFAQPGDGIGSRLARLNGSNWDLIEGKVLGSVFTLTVDGDWIYVGGNFDGVGSTSAKNVIRWNSVTEEWGALGSKEAGPTNDVDNAYVATISVDGDNVYLGGNFSRVGSMPAYNIVRWNSATDVWDTLGRGINGTVFSIVPDGEKVYAGGRFLGAGTVLSARNIALWNGSAWQELDSGTSEVVWTMEQLGRRIYVGGDFLRAGNREAKYIAAIDMDSQSWVDINGEIGGSFLPTISTMTNTLGNLYVGGNFETAGGTLASNVARYNGSDWGTLGSGVSNAVFEMTANDGKIYVAGAFLEAGGKPSYYFGIYTDPALTVENDERAETVTSASAYPNPFVGQTMINFQTTRPGQVVLRVYDAQGALVRRLVDNPLPAGEHRIVWEAADDLPTGTYFVRIESEGSNRSVTVQKY